jgi:hypothetical protein
MDAIRNGGSSVTHEVLAFPLVQGFGRAHEGTDQKGAVESLDRQGL